MICHTRKRRRRLARGGHLSEIDMGCVAELGAENLETMNTRALFGSIVPLLW